MSDGWATFFAMCIFGFGAIIILGVISGIRLNSEIGGHHTGYVTAVDQEGLFFPNYHVFVKTDNSSSQEDEYCVNQHNDELARKLQQLSRDRKLVTVNYDGVKGFGWHLCYGEEIKSVDVVK